VRWLVVDAGAITGVDYSGGSTLRDLHDDLAKLGVVLAFARVNDTLLADLKRLKLTDALGSGRLFTSRKQCIATFHAETSPTQSAPS
jgi:MFS superfamily sulfate permease-like transporter